jgi:hypothetical protein
MHKTIHFSINNSNNSKITQDSNPLEPMVVLLVEHKMFNGRHKIIQTTLKMIFLVWEDNNK